ncbi:non-hydrolyzing UDP-N-acetylglucosamine 2-epimerase [Thermotoga profunda]|uniref:non-hydrolyzing UDP-N-acetylglucosamine 2-epimerase n=1 Tax=Thermotoga profunda TaxID=1508420 RepID=UPI000596C5B8|nr:UDP-N-acetylglucosamine 2-epimerase (non-hydrolyzing) [Thermotoga profunda]
MKSCFVFGTRPEVIKTAPVYLYFKNLGEEVILIATAQHREMMDMMIKVFNIKPDYDLDVMTQNQSLNMIVSRVMERIEPILMKERPDIVFVQGDTTTALSACLAAFHLSIPVAHIEAGLRSGDLYDPFPEELNRRLIDVSCRYLFAPTKRAKENLLREGLDENRIFIVGNTVIDALELIRKKINMVSLRKELIDSDYYILMTLHRRENIGEKMRSILRATADFAQKNDIRVVFPVHKNPNVRQIVDEEVGKNPNFILIEPVDYLHFLSLLDGAKFVVTDSGGVQEEAPSFNKFVVVARQTTERPELIEAGLGILAGTSKETVYEAINEANRKNLNSIENPFGDGKSSERIYKIIRGDIA